MTTSVQIECAPDLSVENPVMNFGRVRIPPDIQLAGATWLVVGSAPLEALRLVLRFVLRTISAKIPTHSCWLVIGSSTWQPESRLVRHHKLWGALTARGIDIPGDNRMQHTEENTEGRLKFFGAIQISEFSSEAVAKALFEELCAYIAVFPSEFSPRSILEIGWSGSLVEDIPLLESVSEVNGLLFKRIGEFDDKDWGLIGVGQPQILNALLR